MYLRLSWYNHKVNTRLYTLSFITVILFRCFYLCLGGGIWKLLGWNFHSVLSFVQSLKHNDWINMSYFLLFNLKLNKYGSFKMMLHGMIRNDDFQHNRALQHCCNIESNGCNVVPTFQSCVALKAIVANHNDFKGHLLPSLHFLVISLQFK